MRASIETLDACALERILEGDSEGYNAANALIARLRADIEFGAEVPEVDYETRLKVTEEVFRAVVDHAASGGSFRGLIYGRLGFQSDAYVPLYYAGGMAITNEFLMLAPDDQHYELLKTCEAHADTLPVGKERSAMFDLVLLTKGLLSVLAVEHEKRAKMQAEIDHLISAIPERERETAGT